MRYSTAMIVAAIGIGEAVAGPAHAHLHRRVHEKKDVDWSTLDWDAMGINWSSAWAAGQAGQTQGVAAPAVAEATATAAAAPAVATGSSSSSTSSTTTPDDLAAALVSDVTNVVANVVDDVTMLFKGLRGAANSRTSFGADSGTEGGSEVYAVGNYGNPYGSNVMKVSSSDGHDLTTTFVNTQSQGITINCWNKVGSDYKENSGQSRAPFDTTLTMYLPAGKSQTVAFMPNSQGGCAEATENLNMAGAYATTWFEFNMDTRGSGYDVSAIPNTNGNNYNMTITANETPCVSSMNENMWLTPTEPVGTSDGSCYIPSGSATLTVQMGGVI